MTTICWKGGVLAADTQVNTGDTRAGFTMKIGKTPDGALWAWTGEYMRQGAFVAWAEGDRTEDPPKFDGEKNTGILIHDGKVREWWGEGWTEEREPFAAWGSGWQFALGALEMGAGAEEAVAVACKFDVWSGGSIVRMSVGVVEAKPVAEAPPVDAKPEPEPPELKPLNFDEMIAKYGVTPQSEGGAQPEDWREARGLR